ncbi:hypothetical protein HHK36_006752 [Tetracentron sinense]|uniref:POT1A/B-like OB fold domain-containing protein n=1 Tax=Tetracentron sinense TaxID=13715 RepID=A0A834ZI17_TETSI|nr:hypothetical protein HHK36_006752 [Tetracentron sinense]
MNHRLADEMEKPLPLQLESLPFSRDVLCTFPSVGSILRVTVETGNEKLGLHLLDSGKWVKFINIICQVRSDLWHGVMKPFTKLRILPNEDNIILQRQRFYDERISTKWDRMPLSSFDWPSRITETDYEHVPFVTLMDVLTYPEVTAKFKCVVRVVTMLPWRVEDFRSPLGIYRMRLTLEDPTARIHALIYAEDGEKFFGGYPSVDVMTRKRNELLGVAERDYGTEIENRNPPWVQCCIKSYYLVKSDIWGSRHYRIFGTSLVG